MFGHRNRLPQNKSSGPSAWETGIVLEKEYEELAPKGYVRVRFPGRDGVVSKPLQVGFPFASVDKWYCMPKINDEVICLVDPELRHGVVLCAVYNAKDVPPVDTYHKHRIHFEDDTYIEYDKENQVLTVDTPGKIVINALKGIEVTAPEGMTIDATDGMAVNAQKGMALTANDAVTIETPAGLQVSSVPDNTTVNGSAVVVVGGQDDDTIPEPNTIVISGQ